MFGRDKMFTGPVVTRETPFVPGMATIYGLYGAGSSEPRYIGVTIQHPYKRLQGHLYEATRTAGTSYKLNWMRKEIAEHGADAIVMRSLTTVPAMRMCAEEERYMKAGFERTYRLTNSPTATCKDEQIEDALAIAQDRDIPMAIKVLILSAVLGAAAVPFIRWYDRAGRLGVVRARALLAKLLHRFLQRRRKDQGGPPPDASPDHPLDHAIPPLDAPSVYSTTDVTAAALLDDEADDTPAATSAD